MNNENKNEPLDPFKKRSNPHSFADILRCVETYKIDKKRGSPPNFLRESGEGSKGELWFRNRLAWLRTIPLSNMECFTFLHDEVGVYAEERSGRCSADLLGLHRTKKTTKLAVVELKYGKNGDILPYACAEGLRNLYLHLQGLSRLADNWKTLNYTAWHEGNPFAGLAKHKATLLIIGDNEWASAQTDFQHILPQKPIKLGPWNIEIAAFASPKGAKHNSKPYALLPLRKLK